MNITLPIEHPVIMLALCLLLMMVVPPLCRRIGVPTIFGLILSGIIIGPHGLQLIGEKSGLELFSTTGLLYLMFLMTLEMDMYAFRKNTGKSVWFGIFTFAIPFVLGYLVTYYLFSYSHIASLVVGCMLSSHTLVSYPIATRLHITRTVPVVIGIGGTIITDVLMLLLFTTLSTAYEGSLNFWFWLKTFALLGGFMLTMLWLFPRVSRWYFSHFQSDETSQFVFVMFALFLSGWLAYLAGIEPIVGAFFCGLALNRIIPHQSSLMNRTVFIGNSLFIPFFMIDIGMQVDVKAFFDGADTLALALALLAAGLAGKYLAALVTRLRYRYSHAEQMLLFGLSGSRAAATIAVALIAFRMNIFGSEVLNAAVILILVTCLVSAYFTDKAGRQLASQHRGYESSQVLADRIVVPVANPDKAVTLLDFAVMLYRYGTNSIVYPLSVVTEPAQLVHSVLRSKRLTDLFAAHSATVRLQPFTRIDSNISEGIIRASLELQASHIVIGWSGHSGTARYFFGTIVENLLYYCKQTVIVARLPAHRLKYEKLYILVPLHAEHEIGVHSWLTAMQRLWLNSTSVRFIGEQQTLRSIAAMQVTASLSERNFTATDHVPDMAALAEELSDKDLIVVISARQNTVSYTRRLSLMPRVVSRYFGHTNSIILYPEQPEPVLDNFGSAFTS